MARIKVNGREIEAPEGANLLKTILDAGIFVPHYCYHPGLSPEGNCRMCIVKVSGSRKLEPVCMWKVRDGLEVVTDDAEVAAARRYVLEYMLVNHPVDCPICDKAGECDLQDFTFDYRGGLSRVPKKDKVIKHTKDLGPNIRIWGNRCIVCSRCVRFLNEVAGTGEFTIVERGDHSVVDTFPGLPVDNPMSLNVVDICPVGALIDKNFLYQARVWYARETPTTCPSCARGCSVSLTTLDNQIKRVVPRYNPHVNDYWMCDIGRLEARYVHSPRRLLVPRGPWAQARELFRGGTAAAGTWAIVFSTFQTLEEMFLLKKLAESLGARVAVWSDARGARWEARNGFTIEPDRSPNTAGARMLFGDDAVERGLTGLLEDAPERILLVNGNPRAVWPLELEDAVARAKVSIVCDVMDSPLVAQAQYALPGLTFAEKDGTVVNAGRRLLRFRRAVIPPETAIPEIEWLQEILIARGVRSRTISAEGVFRELAAEMPSLGVSTYADIGDLGRALP